jgi:hypothetical protein
MDRLILFDRNFGKIIESLVDGGLVMVEKFLRAVEAAHRIEGMGNSTRGCRKCAIMGRNLASPTAGKEHIRWALG